MLTPISKTMASIMLPITVMKSNTFHGSLKKFYQSLCEEETEIYDKPLIKLVQNVTRNKSKKIYLKPKHKLFGRKDVLFSMTDLLELFVFKLMNFLIMLRIKMKSNILILISSLKNDSVLKAILWRFLRKKLISLFVLRQCC